MYRIGKGIFEVLSEKFKYNGMILLLQYCRGMSKDNESAEEWMGHLWVKAKKCEYKEWHIQNKKQFINGFNDDIMVTKIIRELTMMKKTNEVTGEQVLSWDRWMEVQRVQKNNFRHYEKK